MSPISAFEVAALHHAGRIHFRVSAEQWIHEALQQIRVADLSVVVAIDAGSIPRTALPDPADRLLVAAARRGDGTLVTADRAILAYARTGHVRVHDASR